MGTMLSFTELTTEQEEYVSVIKESGSIMLTLVNNILVEKSMNNTRMNLKYEAFNLKESTENCINSLKIQIEQKGLEFQLNVEEITYTVLGDSFKLNQILTNLITNSIKFTEKGNINVSVKITSEDSEKYLFRFSVSDTGIGIKEENIQKLFVPFSQVSGDKNYGGSGLGLSICKKLVKLMGGEIYVKSVFGKGSTFLVDLTMFKADLI